jgi:hypothetical protein
MKHSITTFLTAAALLLGAQNANAQTNAARSPWIVAADLGPHWHTADSYQPLVLGVGPRATGGISAGRDLVHFGSRLTLAANANWRVEAVTGYARQSFVTALTSNHLHADVTLRWELMSWLTPYARIAGGATALDVSLQDTQGKILKGTSWTPSAATGLGVTVTSNLWFESLGFHTLRATVSVEGGYQFVAPGEIRVATPLPNDERAANDLLTNRSVSLGTLDASSAYLRVLAGFRF